VTRGAAGDVAGRTGPLRAVLAALALGAAVPGAWAAFAPRSFYDDFPGTGHWVSRLPAYSEHLVMDVGAFYLAFALMLGWAALRPAPALVIPLCSGWAVFCAVHLAWHATHLEGFGAANAIGQTAALAAVLAATLAALVLARRARHAATPSRPPPEAAKT
jgi:hypothetical protein